MSGGRTSNASDLKIVPAPLVLVIGDELQDPHDLSHLLRHPVGQVVPVLPRLLASLPSLHPQTDKYMVVPILHFLLTLTSLHPQTDKYKLQRSMMDDSSDSPLPGINRQTNIDLGG